MGEDGNEAAGSRNQEMPRAARRMLKDVDNLMLNIDLLLANARVPGAGPIEVEKIDSIREVLEGAVENFQFNGERERRMVYVAPGGGDFAVIGHPRMLRFVLHNLIKNAIKSVRKKRGDRRIEIRILAQQRVVQVEDDGVGILPEVVGRVFEEFFSYPPGEGTGIGLAFCRQVMRDTGGDISVKSVAGEGAKFSLRFAPVEVVLAKRKNQ
jgi:signal transduction histidine kinase